MDLLEKLSKTVDSNLSSIRQHIQEALTRLRSKENQLNAIQESVMETSKETDLMRKSIEERLKQVDEKEEQLKELRLIQERWLKELETKKKEINVREEKLNEQEKLIQELFEKIELDRIKFEGIQESIDGRFDQISQKERILVQKLERHNLESQLKEKIFSSREEELVAKEKELVAREKVLASRNEQIVSKEKQLELRNMILDLKTPEKDGCIVLADGGKANFGLPISDAALKGEYDDLRKKRGRTIQGNEVIIPPEGSLPLRNSGKSQVDREGGGKLLISLVAKEKQLEGGETGLILRNEELVSEDTEFEEKKEKILASGAVEMEDCGVWGNVLTSRNNLIIPKEEQHERREKLSGVMTEGKDGSVGLTDGEKGDSGQPNADPVQHGESRTLTKKNRKRQRGRPRTNQVELRILYLKTEPQDGKIDFSYGGKAEYGLPDVVAAQQGESKYSRIKSNKRGRPCQNKVILPGSGDSMVAGNKLSESNPAKAWCPSPQIRKCPVSEFYDFEKDRKEFLPGETWACYDGVDGMPRTYMRILQTSSQGLKGGVLVFDPSRRGIDWKEKDLPAGCGKFISEGSEIITNPSKFSHQMVSECCSSRGYWIYPRKGEIWALFKDWEIASSCVSGSHKQFKYEIVEVLSDFIEITGIKVTYLEKIGGYASLFQRTTKDCPFSILPDELFKFSHRIHAYQMNGTEREGVPKGSFELDPAALPSNLR